MKISQLDVLTACWHTAQHNSDYSKSNIGKIEHELAKYIQNNHNLSKEEFFLKYINRTINISFIPTSDACIYNHRTTKTNQKYPSVNL